MSEQASGPQGSTGFIRNPQDFWGGVVLIAIAIFAYYASSDLPGMRGFSFGPGTAPRLFCYLLGIFGLLVAVTGLLTPGPAMPRYAIRGPLLVTASIVMFAALIRPLGLVPTSFLMFLFAASGSNETRWVEATIAAAALTVFCVLLFVYLLNLPFQLWPRFTLFGLSIAF